MDGCSDVDSFCNKEAIEYATTVVYLVMKESFTVDANYARYIKLRECFETFSYLISQPEKFPVAKAYDHFGEPITLLFVLYSKDEGQRKKRMETELGRVKQEAKIKLLTWMQSLSYRRGQMATEIMLGLLSKL
ncbi:hypothetical protein Salat_2137900 [Sesamum alatum]|uniref:Uncharacterized protein n=1 Tax=Sesamum alatum TaxID=300844 RepID=A0AAE1Y2F5_9LAMI|nr:hypothetical protein Salat_2137900 [Sesamum alatum]